MKEAKLTQSCAGYSKFPKVASGFSCTPSNQFLHRDQDHSKGLVWNEISCVDSKALALTVEECIQIFWYCLKLEENLECLHHRSRNRERELVSGEGVVRWDGYIRLDWGSLPMKPRESALEKEGSGTGILA